MFKKKKDKITFVRHYCGWCYCEKYHASGRTEPGPFSCGAKDCNKNHWKWKAWTGNV